ncbi:heme/hemin ABC transporter substrate-binding protein [Rhodobacter maris]|uniref:Iron complex transport system substrate-binding protein n=1 Tax=Rhodobacter maris TaxID=446682 RepID=A0A285RHZ0_9RHOB|nr:ABC transporter substrate-binding protein [Rhodobacter maris]SOB93691.1 iron complex transport system substrate-binding protein [Rhodobacter maris]
MKGLLLAAGITLTPFMVAAQERVLSIGGAVSEIVAELGATGRLVGRDTTTTYPPELTTLPDVGYMRALSPEGLLSLNPDLILLSEGAGPPETLAMLEGAGVRMVKVPEGHDTGAVAEKVRVIAAALGMAAEGAALAEKLDAEITAAAAEAATGGPKPRVLFLLSNSGGRLTGAGTDTSAAAMIALAGGTNALPGFSGYKALGDEAITAAAPDVLLVMTRSGNAPSEGADYLDHPALAATPAGQAQRLIEMDGMFLLGFGPRTAPAIRALHTALFPGEG